MDATSTSWSTQQGTSFPQQVHLTDYLNIIRRRKWVVIIFFLAVVGLVTAASFLSPPTYRATTQIIIEKQSPLVHVGEDTTADLRKDDYYQTQCNLLQSRSLAYKVIEDLELWKDFVFNKTENVNDSTSAPDGLRNLGNKLASNAIAAPSKASRSQIKPAIVDWYLSNLQITPVRGSHLVNISYLGSSPEMITRIVNALTRAFIEENIQTQKSAAQKAFSWIKTQLQEQKAEVEASQRAIHEYKKQNNIVTVEGRDIIVSQKLMELNSALTQAKAERMAKQAIYDQLKSFSVKNETLFSLPEIARNAVIQNLRSQLVQLKAKRIEMTTKYGPKHPKMIELNSGIKQLEQELTGEVRRLRKAIKADLDRAIAIEQSAQKTLDAQKQAAMALGEKEINYDVLRRQAESNQQIYDILLKQAKEISLTSVMDSSNVRIVDKAEVPRFPVKPRIFMNILLAVVLGLFMGTGLAFFFEYMDNTVKTPEDVSRRLSMSLLSVLPYQKSLNGEPALPWHDFSGTEKDKGSVAYPLYDISSRFPSSFHLTEQSVSGQVLMVESATMGEGKTTVLANLAMNLAGAGHRVLMVDCDLQRPTLHHLFGIKNEGGLAKGMTQVLSHKIDSGSLDRRLSVDDLFFLTALKKRSGQLTVKNESQTMIVHFQNGRLLHIQNQNNPLSNRLGTMLLRSGFITKDRLKEALERHQRTGQPLGYILINAGYISRDKLQGPLRLQMEEHLQKLFSWKKGSFVFTPGRVETYENERIHFGEDYTPTIRQLGQLAGSRLIENEILSHIILSRKANLYVLPAGKATSRPNGQVNLTILKKFLEILKLRFDVVLMDAPPLDAEAGAAALSSLADGVILVIKAGHLSVKVLNEAKNSLPGEKIIGAILNQVRSGRDYHYKVI